ncbi:MAG: CNNM domain-containing protein [Cyclobacteriaceae bacterium]
MTLLIVYLAIALLVSFLCSILEAVLLSITPSYVTSLKDHGKAELSEKLGKLKKDIDKPLAAILSFNTIAHTVGAAGVGAQAAKVFGNEYLGIVSGVLTLLILVFSEIIPKTIGATFWRSLDGFTANVLNVLIILMYPLVLMSQGITKLISGNRKKLTISRAEVSAMAEIGQREGIFKETESKMLKNMIRMRNITAEDIMTPRTVMVTAQQDITVSDLYKDEGFKKFSRIPIYTNNRDDIIGYVHKNDVLSSMAEDKPDQKLKEIKRKILFIDKNTPLPVLLDKIMETKEHIVLVNDNYGSVTGLVTLEDVMETVLGMEITDEYDTHTDMQHYARERWRERARELGILEEDEENRRKIAQYGITGGQPPQEPDKEK